MERTGIEPVTSGLQSREGGDDARRRSMTIGPQRHKPRGVPRIPSACLPDAVEAPLARFWR
jgi:hypothetical protein